MASAQAPSHRHRPSPSRKDHIKAGKKRAASSKELATPTVPVLRAALVESPCRPSASCLVVRWAGGIRRRGLRRGCEHEGRVLPKELHGQEHLVERVYGDGLGGVDAADDLGPGPHGLHIHVGHVVSEVECVGRPREAVHRVERAQVFELGQGVELGERVV